MKKETTFDYNIGKMIEVIEELILIDASEQIVRKYNNDALRASMYIFSIIVISKMKGIQENENMAQEDLNKMVIALAEDLKKIVWTYANVKTEDLYTQKNKIKA